MRGDEVIDQGDIVVTDHRIVAVGPKGSVKVPERSQSHRCDGENDRSRVSSTPMPTGRRFDAACSICRTGAFSPTSPMA